MFTNYERLPEANTDEFNVYVGMITRVKYIYVMYNKINSIIIILWVQYNMQTF